MPLSVIRFDMRSPGLEPPEAQQRYAVALEMASWAEDNGFDLCVLSEHHGSEDGYLSSPLVMAAAIAGRTKRIPINVAALLVPLYDPLRLAEDLAVLDLISNGRISIVAGLGYRPVEYAMFERDWKTRGKDLDEFLEVMVKAWTGEPFEYRGTTVRVTPRPVQRPHPMIMVGGSAPASAKRAARFGFGYYPPLGDERLSRMYYEECERLGKDPGWVATPKGPGTIFVSEDPDRTWARIGPHLLHEATTYHSWQNPGNRMPGNKQASAVDSSATTVDELREEGVFVVLTPEECLALADELGAMGPYTLHPLCGGTPPEAGWESLELFVSKVLPNLPSNGMPGVPRPDTT